MADHDDEERARRDALAATITDAVQRALDLTRPTLAQRIAAGYEQEAKAVAERQAAKRAARGAEPDRPPRGKRRPGRGR